MAERGLRHGAVVLVVGVLAAATPALGCTGDLDGDGMVVVSELVAGVGAALGLQPIAVAAAFDADGDDLIGVHELIAAVGYALRGCPVPAPTATATPEPEPERERVFAVEPGDPQGHPDTARSGFFTSALEGVSAAATITGDPLVLRMGAAGADGVAPLGLAADATLGVTFLDDSCLCLTLLASTATGAIDCDGGTAFDVSATRPDGSPDFTWTVSSGGGDPAPAGSAALLAMGRFERVPLPCAVADCATRGTATPPNLFAFTTAQATAVQETSGPPLTLTVSGEPFACDTFETIASGGMLAAPIPATIPPIGDVANVLRLAERP